MTLLIFLMTLSVMVLVHELGHYFVAKKNGIRVEEFGLGLPPMVYGKKIGETLYSLNLLPFGGFVKLTGEEVDEDEERYLVDPKSFISKKPLQRAAVLVAGVGMNLVLAVVVFYIFLFANGFKSFEFPLFFDYKFAFGETRSIGTVVTGIREDSPAAQAGIKYGEAVISIDGAEVSTVEGVKDILKGKLGTTVNVTLRDMTKRDESKIRTVILQPTTNDMGEEILGVYLGEFIFVEYTKPYERIFAGFLHLYNTTSYSIKAIGKVISFSFESKDLEPVSSSIAGPVGIYQLVGGILQLDTREAFLSLLDFVGLMSMSLAIVNILPLPALDGGRVLFVLIEAIRGKRINPKLETTLHRYGMAFLLGLLFLVTLKDIFR
ncbi:site-2 protease family protein [Patescibacteria group bacterium]|nr:site-2 protease family protein [Patescibacteria group bacterium]